MSHTTNLEIVRQGYAAFARGDLHGVISMMGPYVTWTTPGPPDLPIAGTRHGQVGVAHFFSALLDVLDIVRLDPDEFVAQGDTVVALGRLTCLVKATGKTVDLRWANVVTLADGLIVGFEVIGDVSVLVNEVRQAQARL